jgi:hypothetical protein
MNEVSHHLGNDSPSFHPVHSLIRAVGPPDLHHAKGRGPGRGGDRLSGREVTGWRSRNDGAGFPVSARKSLRRMTLLAIAADWDPIFGQVIHNQPTAVAGIIKVESIDPGQGPQDRFTHRGTGYIGWILGEPAACIGG